MNERIISVRTRPMEVSTTPRLRREAAGWIAANRRPPKLVTPRPGQQSVWDSRRPPALERVLDRVTVSFAGTLIADSGSALRVCETASPPTCYIPAEDVRVELLHPEEGAGFSEWRGAASYHGLQSPEGLSQLPGAAQNPSPPFRLG